MLYYCITFIAPIEITFIFWGIVYGLSCYVIAYLITLHDWLLLPGQTINHMFVYCKKKHFDI